MHDPRLVYRALRTAGFDLFAGVPDSLLKEFCACVNDQGTENDHVITANEGNAIALAGGHYLGSGNPAVVYMQNSGLGNAVNPLLSLADSEVYALPMLLMIGWRGEPGVPDEPQHVKQGRVMTDLLDAMEIPWFVLAADTTDPEALIGEAAKRMHDVHAPVAVLVRKNAFAEYRPGAESTVDYPLVREDAVRCVIDNLGAEDVIVSTTGKTSREVYEYRAARGDGHGNDFLTVGAMGHTASIAMGVARAQPGRNVICLDGDGSVIMHMGALAIIGQADVSNLLHVVINNGVHDSVGGQPTAGFDIDLPAIAIACGYTRAESVSQPQEIVEAIRSCLAEAGPVFLEIRTRKGARADLARPKTSPLENRDALMQRLVKSSGTQ